MSTGQREGEGRRVGQRGRDPNLDRGRQMSGKSHFYKRGNPSELLSARPIHYPNIVLLIEPSASKTAQLGPNRTVSL